MAYDESNSCVFLYDFSSALTLERLGSRAFAKACTSELEHFDSHVSSIIMAQAEQAIPCLPLCLYFRVHPRCVYVKRCCLSAFQASTPQRLRRSADMEVHVIPQRM
jgi:hypothetical protein